MAQYVLFLVLLQTQSLLGYRDSLLIHELFQVRLCFLEVFNYLFLPNNLLPNLVTYHLLSHNFMDQQSRFGLSSASLPLKG